MKKFILPIVMLTMLAACGGSSDKKTDGDKKEDKTTVAADDISANPDYQKGLDLIGSNDCLTCHKVEDKVTGPSYREVANKYAGLSDTVVTYLANKIVKGGTGNWGSVPMVAHTGVSQADAEAMVKYILLLKK